MLNVLLGVAVSRLHYILLQRAPNTGPDLLRVAAVSHPPDSPEDFHSKKIKAFPWSALSFVFHDAHAAFLRGSRTAGMRGHISWWLGLTHRRRLPRGFICDRGLQRVCRGPWVSVPSAGRCRFPQTMIFALKSPYSRSTRDR